MDIYYLFHSGFAVKSESCTVVFDFWHDPSKTLPGLLSDGKPIYVLCSHHHCDHFNKDVFSWKQKYGGVTFLFARDVFEAGLCTEDRVDHWFLKGDSWADGNIRVTAMGSNDCGVSWIVWLDGKCVFHAGDLNNWYAKYLDEKYSGRKIYSYEFQIDIDPADEERKFLAELEDIREVAGSFDVAFFPVDGRIGNGYTLGARQFLQRFNVRLLVPMHFVLAGFQSAWRMNDYAVEAGAEFWCIPTNGAGYSVE